MKRLLAVIFLLILCSFSFAEDGPPIVITNIEEYSPTNPKTEVIRVRDKAPTEQEVKGPGNGQKSGVIANEVIIRYYEKPSMGINIKYITVQLNGIPVEMIFDTGASTIVVNSETFSKLRIISPLTKVTAHTAGGNADNYIFELPSVKIGTIEIKKVMASYAPASEMNLLGGSFLNKFKYLIDEKRKIIIVHLAGPEEK